MKTVLILGCGGAAGINFCRALRRAGRYRLVGTDCSFDRLLLPDLDARCMLDRVDAPGRTLRAIIERERVDVIYAQADKEVRFLLEHAAEYGAATLLPTLAGLVAGEDKLALNRRLHGQAVDVPNASSDCLDPDVFEQIKSRSGKVWVRSRRGAGSRGAMPVTSLVRAANWIDLCGERMGLTPADFMISEYLPGAEYAWQGLYMDGFLVASFARQRLEYMFGEQMPSGQSSSPSLAVTVRDEHLDDTAQRAVRAIEQRPNGVYGVDAKRNAQGVICVTEINVGRFYTTCDFAASCGLNMPDLLVRCALREPLPQIAPVKPGIRWVRSVDREAVICG